MLGAQHLIVERPGGVPGPEEPCHGTVRRAESGLVTERPDDN